MTDYLIGNIVGLTQVSIGYPFDTLKTNIQNGYKISQIPSIKQLFNGIKYPLIGASLYNTFIFGNFNKLNKHINNPIISGSISGFIGSFILNPFETHKVNSQYLLSTKQKLKPYIGLNYMLMRETISNGIYFGVYHYCKNNLELSSFLSGGMAGINSWLWTFPFDSLRVRKQLNPTFKIKELINIAPLYRGLSITLFRAFFVNSCGFYVYDKLKNY
jgi:solute carrier family 25 carnitine/acylcarnitine transporter 20/29